MAVKEMRITIVGCGPGGEGWVGDLARLRSGLRLLPQSR